MTSWYSKYACEIFLTYSLKMLKVGDDELWSDTKLLTNGNSIYHSSYFMALGDILQQYSTLFLSSQNSMRFLYWPYIKGHLAQNLFFKNDGPVRSRIALKMELECTCFIVRLIHTQMLLSLYYVFSLSVSTQST